MCGRESSRKEGKQKDGKGGIKRIAKEDWRIQGWSETERDYGIQRVKMEGESYTAGKKMEREREGERKG